jgi:uncharacterized protein DUF5615
VRLVADENCHVSVVIDLRLAGHDVDSIAEQMPDADNGTVIDFALTSANLQ